MTTVHTLHKHTRDISSASTNQDCVFCVGNYGIPQKFKNLVVQKVCSRFHARRGSKPDHCRELVRQPTAVIKWSQMTTPGSPGGDPPPSANDPEVLAAAAALPPPPDFAEAKLFLGLCQWPAGDAEVQGLMQKYGDLEVCYVLKAKGGGSKGCAFVKYASKAHGNLAIAALNGKITMPGGNAPLVVKWAEPPPAPGQFETAAHLRAAVEIPVTAVRLFIGLSSYTTTDENVRKLLEQFGEVEEAYVMKAKGGASKGCAMVHLKSRAVGQTAIDALHQKYTFEGGDRPIIVKFADPPKALVFVCVCLSVCTCARACFFSSVRLALSLSLSGLSMSVAMSCLCFGLCFGLFLRLCLRPSVQLHTRLTCWAYSCALTRSRRDGTLVSLGVKLTNNNSKHSLNSEEGVGLEEGGLEGEGLEGASGEEAVEVTRNNLCCRFSSRKI